MLAFQQKLVYHTGIHLSTKKLKKFQKILRKSRCNYALQKYSVFGVRSVFVLVLITSQNYADKSAASFVYNSLQCLLKFKSCIVGHTHQFSAQVLVYQVV